MRGVKGYPGYTITECGKVFDPLGVQRTEYLSGIPAYKYVNMPSYTPAGIRNGGWQIKRVHILVAQTYIPNPDNLPMVDHKNRDKLDNHKDNLHWVTRSGNNRNTVRSVYVDLHGEPVLLVELCHTMYGELQPHYTYIWNKINRKGCTLEEAVVANSAFRKIPIPPQIFKPSS